MTSRAYALNEAKRFSMSQMLAIITLTVLPALSVWADGQIQEVPVISSYPVYKTVIREEPRQECHIEQVAHRDAGRKSATPAIVGTIVGGALGNAVGSKKSNKRVGAVVGGVLGYSIGRDIARRNAEAHADVRYEDREVCSTVYEQVKEERLTGYDVQYAYGGQTYKSRMRNDPGETIRVQVQVQPL